MKYNYLNVVFKGIQLFCFEIIHITLLENLLRGGDPVKSTPLTLFTCQN